MQKNLQIAVIGNGRAGKYLSGEFMGLGVAITQFSRSADKSCLSLDAYAGMAGKFDLVLLCVSDTAIAEVSSKLVCGNAVIAHISGAISIGQIDKKHSQRAVFYPIMSLSDATDVSIHDIPIALESTEPESMIKLKEICHQLDLKAYALNSAQRSKLHLCAVLSQNFSNYLFQMAFEILDENRMDMELLKPLLLQSVQKLGKGAPINFQTGPAVRNDQVSMNANLNLLKNDDDKKLYRLMSKLIKKKYDEKL